MGVGVSPTPRPPLPPGKDLVRIVQEAGGGGGKLLNIKVSFDILYNFRYMSNSKNNSARYYHEVQRSSCKVLVIPDGYQ